ncbi:hypothetical protein N9W70_03230 [Schleiferiaceae bacterium]|jgi:hypothetical protein|nr:hypothetical protein [Schleiferiaceae bacterium]MDB2473444.1 hypothetical protein [Schleiferiaceae bacterium]
MKKFLVLSLVLCNLVGKAQEVLPWELLAVPYSTTPDGLYEPQFPSWLDKYQNQEIVIQGYLVPVDVEGNQYALSRYAFSSCFFCGNAEPNTVVELVFKERPDNLITDQFVVVKGILMFNSNDPFRLFFILQQVEFAG